MSKDNELYLRENLMPACGRELVTPQILFTVLKRGLNEPKNYDKLFFNLSTKKYHISGGKEVNPVADESVVENRLNLICHLMTSLDNRQDNGKPVYTLTETFDAFSVILCNWISIHGCLSDGNGRAGAILMQHTLEKAGYPNNVFKKDLFDNHGEVDMNRAMYTLIFPDVVPRFSGLRNLAALIDLDETGSVHPDLLDRRIISIKSCRQKANKRALKIIGRHLNQLIDVGVNG